MDSSDSGVGSGSSGVSAAASGLNNERPAFDPVLACPSTLGDLTDGFRSYGGALSVSYKSSKKLPGTKVERRERTHATV
ncbi:unnamed protein product [Laminaria digitata]